jgi:FHS family glucose/mannose:H+ symporter-like MFS transporter
VSGTEHCSSPHDKWTTGPALGWLAACFLLAGLGTVMLGPILPSVAARWGLTDAQSGRLFLAKFAMACVGGVLVSRRLRLSLVLGATLAGAGFASFGAAPGLRTGMLAIAVAGFGLGQMIAATNILAGRRFRRHAGSALSALNFFFSLGAVSTGILVAKFLPPWGLRGTMAAFAGLFAACALGTAWPTRTMRSPLTDDEPPGHRKMTRGVFLAFCAVLFLYGGLETSLSSWLTTFSTRFGSDKALGGQTAIVIFWAALTAGRAIASALLRVVREWVVQAAGLAVVASVTAFLALRHVHHGLAWECVVMGLALAAYFPAAFGLLMRHRPSPREAGIVLAISGLGAAIFPWLMGVVSTGTGSLRTAMLVPAALAVALLTVSSLRILRSSTPG